MVKKKKKRSSNFDSKQLNTDYLLNILCSWPYTHCRIYRFCTHILKSHRGYTVVLLIPGAYEGCLNLKWSKKLSHFMFRLCTAKSRVITLIVVLPHCPYEWTLGMASYCLHTQSTKSFFKKKWETEVEGANMKNLT